jgi:hypothetical protein
LPAPCESSRGLSVLSVGVRGLCRCPRLILYGRYGPPASFGLKCRQRPPGSRSYFRCLAHHDEVHRNFKPAHGHRRIIPQYPGNKSLNPPSKYSSTKPLTRTFTQLTEFEVSRMFNSCCRRLELNVLYLDDAHDKTRGLTGRPLKGQSTGDRWFGEHETTRTPDGARSAA